MTIALWIIGALIVLLIAGAILTWRLTRGKEDWMFRRPYVISMMVNASVLLVVAMIVIAVVKHFIE